MPAETWMDISFPLDKMSREQKRHPIARNTASTESTRHGRSIEDDLKDFQSDASQTLSLAHSQQAGPATQQVWKRQNDDTAATCNNLDHCPPNLAPEEQQQQEHPINEPLSYHPIIRPHRNPDRHQNKVVAAAASNQTLPMERWQGEEALEDQPWNGLLGVYGDYVRTTTQQMVTQGREWSVLVERGSIDEN